jgi:hypothetical protein
MVSIASILIQGKVITSTSGYVAEMASAAQAGKVKAEPSLIATADSSLREPAGKRFQGTKVEVSPVHAFGSSTYIA